MSQFPSSVCVSSIAPKATNRLPILEHASRYAYRQRRHPRSSSLSPPVRRRNRRSRSRGRFRAPRRIGWRVPRIRRWITATWICRPLLFVQDGLRGAQQIDHGVLVAVQCAATARTLARQPRPCTVPLVGAGSHLNKRRRKDENTCAVWRLLQCQNMECKWIHSRDGNAVFNLLRVALEIPQGLQRSAYLCRLRRGGGGSGKKQNSPSSRRSSR